MILVGKEQVEEFIKENNIKHFTTDEFVCKCGCGQVKVDSELILKIERIREKLGRPIKITSAYRCPEHNKAIGGKPNSAHLKSYALDIAVSNSRERFEIITAALEEGFNRIGVAKSFVHIDIDPDKPQNVIWTY